MSQEIKILLCSRTVDIEKYYVTIQGLLKLVPFKYEGKNNECLDNFLLNLNPAHLKFYYMLRVNAMINTLLCFCVSVE